MDYADGGTLEDVFKAKQKEAKQEHDKNNKFKTIVVFDCRGLEPVDFSPRNGWKV